MDGMSAWLGKMSFFPWAGSLPVWQPGLSGWGLQSPQSIGASEGCFMILLPAWCCEHYKSTGLLNMQNGKSPSLPTLGPLFCHWALQAWLEGLPDKNHSRAASVFHTHIQKWVQAGRTHGKGMRKHSTNLRLIIPHPQNATLELNLKNAICKLVVMGNNLLRASWDEWGKQQRPRALQSTKRWGHKFTSQHLSEMRSGRNHNRDLLENIKSKNKQNPNQKRMREQMEQAG